MGLIGHESDKEARDSQMEETGDPYVQYMYSYPHKTAYGPLVGINLQDYMAELSGGLNSLYFHIPFCQSKCGYCNLFSLERSPASLMERYVDSVERQAEQWAGLIPDHVGFSDLTLGGGTPLLLPEHLLRRIFRIACDYFGMDRQEKPVIVETSPNQTTEEKCRLLREEGVTRVSLGVQSFQEEELRTLHRCHSARQARDAVRILRSVGFECLNLDIIYGIPGQSLSSLRDTLLCACEHSPEEIFAYPLYIKPCTALAREGAVPSEQRFAMGRFVRGFLREQGYVPHSMRRFVRGTLGRSPLCGFGNTLALGCGGRSYLGRLHFCTPYAVRQEDCRRILASYLEQEDYCRPSHGYLLSPDEQKRRYVIRHILSDTGICQQDYQGHFQSEPEEDFPCLVRWVQEGYAAQSEEGFHLTEEGFLLSDHLGPQLMSREVRDRMACYG